MFSDLLITQLVSFVTENIAMCREPEENVTLECSSAGCPSSIEGFTGLYLYREFNLTEAVLYYSLADRISPRRRYTNRIWTHGSLKNYTITISNLTVDDSGLYRCVYKRLPRVEVKCNVYTLVVRGAFCLFLPKHYTRASLKGSNTGESSSSTAQCSFQFNSYSKYLFFGYPFNSALYF